MLKSWGAGEAPRLSHPGVEWLARRQVAWSDGWMADIWEPRRAPRAHECDMQHAGRRAQTHEGSQSCILLRTHRLGKGPLGVAQGHRYSSGTRTQVSAGKLRLIRWFNAVSRQRPSGIRWRHQEAGQPDSSLWSLPYTSQPHVCSEMWGWPLHIPFSPKRVLGDGGFFTGEGGWVLGIPSPRVH